jgi:Fe-S oxidoreductase
MGLLNPAKSLLSRVPGVEIADPDAGCCGMAGSFGYLRDHYEVSRLIGERRLFPAVRNRDPHSVVVAAGTSCRHQILHFTGVEALAPAVLISKLMGT